MNLHTKQQYIHRHRKQTYSYWRGGRRQNTLDVWNNRYTLLYIRQVTNEGRPYSAENYPQYIALTYKGKEYEKRLCVCACVCVYRDFPSGSDGKESAHTGFSPWVRKIPWRREWQPTPVFLPGESHGQRSLAGYNLWVANSQTWLSDYHSLKELNGILTPEKMQWIHIWDLGFKVRAKVKIM